MAPDSFDDSSEKQTSYEQLWQNPEVQEMVRRHFMEQVKAGIFTVYNEGVSRIITETDVYEVEDPEAFARAIVGAELPLAVGADVSADKESEGFEEAFPMALFKVDPRNGKVLHGSFLSVAQIEEDRVTRLYSSFTQEQAELLLRHGKEQTALGLLPKMIYDAYLL